jgi:BirA family biotin operon repressor/biotin-[acetyl-CoA-carboxylase] ligase
MATSVSAKIRIGQLQDSLCTKRLGRTILFSREVDSTNKWAKELTMYGACEGTVVIAETQTRGRGRLGREWVSPTGGLWFSLILRPKLRPAEAVKLTFAAGLAVTKVLREMFGLKSETKWPNDVLVNGRKICGILTEMNTTGETVNFVVVGVGVNANFDVEKALPEQLKKVATSLENELGRKVQLEELFGGLLERLENLYELFTKKGFNPVLEEWKNYAGFLGYQVEVISPTEKLSGLALDVDHDGALVLRLEDGTMRRIFVGDVSLRVQ